MSEYPEAPHKERYLSTGTSTRFGVKVTKKPRCWKCGQVMKNTFIKIKKSPKAVNKTVVKLDKLWYCPDCDVAIKEL